MGGRQEAGFTSIILMLLYPMAFPCMFGAEVRSDGHLAKGFVPSHCCNLGSEPPEELRTPSLCHYF